MQAKLRTSVKTEFEIWKVPFEMESEDFSYGFAYSLIAAFTYGEATGEEIESEELRSLANILLLQERKEIREALSHKVTEDKEYLDLEIYNRYYRWLIRSLFNQQYLMASSIFTTLLPNYKDFGEAFKYLNETMKKVDKELYKTWMCFINVYIMNKLDSLSDKERKMAY